jgi:ribosomal protein S18 acetylase RimI-like enzyme
MSAQITDNKIFVKKCSCFHWRQLVPIIKETFPELSWDDISWHLRTYKRTTYVALQDINVVGFYIYKNDKSQNIIWLAYLGVNKRNRGCGIGTILLKSFIQTTKHHDIKEIKLAAVKNNLSAMKLYEKHGFRKTCEAEKKFVYSQKINKVNNETRNLKRTRNPLYNLAGKIYLKVMYFIMVDLF